MDLLAIATLMVSQAVMAKSTAAPSTSSLEPSSLFDRLVPGWFLLQFASTSQSCNHIELKGEADPGPSTIEDPWRQSQQHQFGIDVQIGDVVRLDGRHHVEAFDALGDSLASVDA